MTSLFCSAVGSDDPCLATLRVTLAFLRDLGKQQQYRGEGGIWELFVLLASGVQEC